jgi:hypothetical protein
VDRIELVAVIPQILECVGLMKFKRIVRLWFYVHSDNFKPCPVVSHASAACTAK